MSDRSQITFYTLHITHYTLHITARRALGYYPQVILAGRAINDHMPKHVAQMMIKGLNEVGKVIKGSKVLIMGLTYKNDVPDTRESPAAGTVEELKEFGGGGLRV